MSTDNDTDRAVRRAAPPSDVDTDGSIHKAAAAFVGRAVNADVCDCMALAQLVFELKKMLVAHRASARAEAFEEAARICDDGVRDECSPTGLAAAVRARAGRVVR